GSGESDVVKKLADFITGLDERLNPQPDRSESFAGTGDVMSLEAVNDAWNEAVAPTHVLFEGMGAVSEAALLRWVGAAGLSRGHGMGEDPVLGDILATVRRSYLLAGRTVQDVGMTLWLQFAAPASPQQVAPPVREAPLLSPGGVDPVVPDGPMSAAPVA